MNVKKIILTGATGFIGKHLVPFLTAQQIELHLLLRNVSEGKKLFPQAKIWDAGLSTKELQDICSRIKPDGVIHLATHFSVSHSADELENMLEANILLGTRLLEAAAPAAGFFLNIGTFWQHYNKERYSPVNLYAATKQAFEDLTVFYADNYPINIATLCLNDTYGPGDTRKKIFNLWYEMHKDPERSLDMSPGEQIMDMLHVDDVVSAIIHAVQLLQNDRARKFNKEIFYVSSSEKLTLKELAELFQKISGSRLNINWGARPYRNREVMYPQCYGKKLPGWKAKINYADGLSDFLNIKGKNNV